METQADRVNFELIVNELLRSLELSTERCKLHGVDSEFWRPNYFREFRTIGFIVPRQLGKSFCLMNWTERDPQAVLIVRDDTLRSELIKRHEQRDAVFGGEMHQVTFAERILTVDEVIERISKSTFWKYETYLIDDSHFVYPYFYATFHDHLMHIKQFDSKIVRVN